MNGTANLKGVLMMALAVCMIVPNATAQQDEQQRIESYRRQEEQVQRQATTQQMDSAIALLDEGAYDLADVKFRSVLRQLQSVPSEFTFYFGKNSYYLGKYKQSIDWISKYIELKGTTGRFYEESTSLLEKAQDAYLQQRQLDSDKAGNILSRNYDIDCGPTGKVICPVCKGSTVIIRKGAFGNEYTTCPYCDQHGLLSCEKYNLLIRGELKP